MVIAQKVVMLNCTDEIPEAKCCSDGINCGEIPVPDPPTPKPGACSFVDGLEYDEDEEHLHWICHGIDAYDKATNLVPSGTVCTAHHSCGTYAYPAGDPSPNYLLSVICDKDKSDGSYKWMSNRDTDADPEDLTSYTDVVNADGKLMEPPCTTPALELTPGIEDAEGLLITCTGTQVTEDKINPPNTCLLLCNYNVIFTFFPGFKLADGEEMNRGWLYATDDGASGDLLGDYICCFDC